MAAALSLERLLALPSTLPADLSADGARVLLLSNRTGTNQLWLADAGGGEPVQLTDLPEPVLGALVPGSETVLLLVDEGGNERHQLFLLDAAPGAEPRPLVVEPDFLHVRPVLARDGATLAYATNRRDGVDLEVVVRSLATGEERVVFAPGGWAEPAGFSPDGRLLAVERLTDRTGDNELHLVDLVTGAATEVLPHADDAYVGAPAWLGDGSAFHVAASVGRDTVAIARVAAADGSWEYVVESDWDLDCQADRAGRRLLVHANEDGVSRLEVRDARTLAALGTPRLPGRGVVLAAALSGDGARVAFGFSSSREPGDTWVWDEATGETRRLTRGIEPDLQEQLVEPELHRFDSFDGESVPAFLWRPRAGGDRPVVVDVHGGPESQRRPQWSPVTQYLVGAGYAVAAPNVRGSTGYGKRYEHLDDVRLRLDSVRDLVALHDWLGALDGVDAGRVALYGASYGGYMVLAGLAFHPERWAAGVDVVGIADLVTFLEHTAEWRRAFREREYGSLARDRDFLRSVSPMSRVDEIRAPLFVIHGANDPRVPVGEARQIHAALTGRGVRCELLVYDDEGHGLQKLRNRLDAYPRVVAFLDEVLGRA